VKKEFILAIAQKNGYEVWAKWDVDAEIYELFTERECECYIGAVDELKDARPFAIDWIAERESA
jgi:hypothetical protein